MFLFIFCYYVDHFMNKMNYLLVVLVETGAVVEDDGYVESVDDEASLTIIEDGS